MPQDDDDVSQFYLSSWNSELGRREKEAILKDPRQHPYLVGLWESQFSTPTWLEPDAIDNLLLIDSIGQGCMSYVCRALSAGGQVRCVKFPNYDAHAPESWPLLEKAIVNEAQVLKRLTDVPNDVGILPRWIADGAVQLADRLCPYVVTDYLFDLKPLSRLDGCSLNEHLQFWIAASQLLELLHARKIVHADLHGANLMIDSRSRPVLLDFGNSQIRQRRLPGRRVERRFFGPLVAFHVDEVLAPHRPLSCAFDVMCLVQLIQSHSHAYLSVHQEQDPNLAPHRWDGTGVQDQIARLSWLVRICTEPEPEYRLPNAFALTNALRCVESGPPVESQRNWKTNLQVLFRKHALLVMTMTASIVLMLALLTIVGLRLRQAQLVSQHQADQIEQDAIALNRLRASNAAALESMRELLKGAVERDRLLEVVSSRARDVVAQRLIEMLEGHILEEESEIIALDLALQLSAAAIELDGVEAAWGVTSRCRAVIEQIYQRSDQQRPELPLVEVYTEAILSRILFERGGLDGGDRGPATQRSSAAAKRFLALPPEQYRTPALQKAYLNTALQLAAQGLFPQREQKCFQQDHGELLYQVLHIALAAASEPDPSIVRELCSLHRLLGLAMHKSVFVGSPHFPKSTNFGELIVEQYAQALRILKGYGSAREGISIDEERQLEASIKSVLGMTLTNILRTEDALAVLHDAYLIRERTAEEFPGSLARQRECISTGWNYADALRNYWLDSQSPDQIAKTLAIEIEVRSKVVDQCKAVMRRDRDRNRESEDAYRVNAVRLACSYYFIDQIEAAERILHEVESTLNADHLCDYRLGLDGLLGLAILSQRTGQTPGETWDSMLKEVNRSLDQSLTRSKPEQQAAQSRRAKQFATAIESMIGNHLRSHADWEVFKGLNR